MDKIIVSGDPTTSWLTSSRFACVDDLVFVLMALMGEPVQIEHFDLEEDLFPDELVSAHDNDPDTYCQAHFEAGNNCCAEAQGKKIL